MMRSVCLVVVLVLAGFGLSGGCDGDNDGGSTTVAQGTRTLGAGDTIVLANVTVTEAGTLEGTITWVGPDPTELIGLFNQVAPSTALGITQSPSPVRSTVSVTSARVAAGEEWEYIGINSSGTAVSVQYTVTFTPSCSTCP